MDGIFMLGSVRGFAACLMLSATTRNDRVKAAKYLSGEISPLDYVCNQFESVYSRVLEDFCHRCFFTVTKAAAKMCECDSLGDDLPFVFHV